MADWIDLTELIPGLNKGPWLHVVQSPIEPLVNTLLENGFLVLVIEGSKISDSKSFFQQAKTVFDLPEYFGENWDAWNESLGEFKLRIAQRTAIVWKDADKTLLSDSKTFLQAVIDLYNMAVAACFISSVTAYQVELFLVGNLEGFKNVLDFR